MSLSCKQAGFRTWSLPLFWKQYCDAFSQSAAPSRSGKAGTGVSIRGRSYGTVNA